MPSTTALLAKEVRKKLPAEFLVSASIPVETWRAGLFGIIVIACLPLFIACSDPALRVNGDASTLSNEDKAQVRIDACIRAYNKSGYSELGWTKLDMEAHCINGVSQQMREESN